MKSKAIKNLNQLSDSDLVFQISEGFDLIFEHIQAIEGEVKFLADQNRKCGFNILESILKEESSKFLILLDAIRCPRTPPDNFSKQLGRFNDHLAKGIYSLVYDYKPVNFKEIREAVERECQEYYLDGPNDFDWIFKNEIIQTREEQIYVDYVENEGKHYWLSPKRYYHPERYLSTLYIKHSVYDVASALWQVGCTKPEALLSIANIWRPIVFNDDFNWIVLKDLNTKTLEELDKLNLLKNQEDKYISIIINNWMFPLYSLKIRIINVDKKELKEVRDRQFFNMYY